MNNLNYIDDNYFQKKVRSLKKYCPKAYKYLIFEFKNEVLKQTNGKYEVDLPTSPEFKFVYGQIKLIYEIRDENLLYIDLIPSDFFIDGYITDLNVYKSIYYRNEKDKFKIDLMFEMKKYRNVENV